MAYYPMIQTPPASAYGPASGNLMANMVALANAGGKAFQNQAMQQAVSDNSLIPEYTKDEQGNITTSYKSPALLNRNYYGAYGPGGGTGGEGPVPKTQPTSKIIQDALAEAALKNATSQVPPGEDISNTSGWTLSPGETPSTTAPAPDELPTDHSQIIQDALMQQANNNPLMAKSLGVLPSNARPRKETIDDAISDAQAGNRTWADVINAYPTKIKQIQMARRNLGAYQAAASTQASSTQPAAAGGGTPPAGAAYYSASTGKYYDANKNEISE